MTNKNESSDLSQFDGFKMRDCILTEIGQKVKPRKRGSHSEIHAKECANCENMTRCDAGLELTKRKFFDCSSFLEKKKEEKK